MSWQDSLERGESAAVIGVGPGERPSPVPLIRVRCAPQDGPLAPWFALRDQLDGGGRGEVDHLARRMVGGLRRRLLGETEAEAPTSLLATIDELAGAQHPRPALAFEAAEHLDAASVRLVEVALRDPTFGTPILLRFHRSPTGPARRLLGLVKADATASATATGEAGATAGAGATGARATTGDAGAKVDTTAAGSGGTLGTGTAAASAVVASAAASGLAGGPEGARAAWADSAPMTLRVLRALAVIGEADADTLGELLGLDPVSVLEALQAAVDAGVRLHDADGALGLDPRDAEALRAGVLPSLAAAWARKVRGLRAEAVGRGETAGEVPEAPPVGIRETPVEVPAAAVEIEGAPPVEIPAAPLEIAGAPETVPGKPPVEIPAAPVKVPGAPETVPAAPVEIPGAPATVPTAPVEIPEAPIEIPEPPPVGIPVAPVEIPGAPETVPGKPPVEIPGAQVEILPLTATLPEAPVKVPEAPETVPRKPPVEIPAALETVPEAPVEIPGGRETVPTAPVEIPEAPIEIPEPPPVGIPAAPVEIPAPPVDVPPPPAPVPEAPVAADTSRTPVAADTSRTPVAADTSRTPVADPAPDLAAPHRARAPGFWVGPSEADPVSVTTPPSFLEDEPAWQGTPARPPSAAPRPPAASPASRAPADPTGTTHAPTPSSPGASGPSPGAPGSVPRLSGASPASRAPADPARTTQAPTASSPTASGPSPAASATSPAASATPPTASAPSPAAPGTAPRPSRASPASSASADLPGTPAPGPRIHFRGVAGPRHAGASPTGPGPTPAASGSDRAAPDPRAPRAAPDPAADTYARAVAVARELLGTGRFDDAAQVLRATLGRAGPPRTPAQAHRRVEALVTLAEVLWSGAGDAADFSLRGALHVLDAALASLPEDAPRGLRAQVRTLLATVCYDLGDPASLQRAMVELVATTRELEAAGDSRGAAALLNDQAAVLVRLGDPVQAAHLLRQSRQVFASHADPGARAELAETEHLLARLPLHVPARAGHEADALDQASEHARAAEATYRALGQVRDLARVWLTQGELELRRRRPDRAFDHLARAAEAQRAVADALGLARTCAVLADVLAAEGRPADALRFLAQSVALNAEKGSPIGLAWNRRGLATLAATRHPAVLSALDALRHQIAEAEARSGRAELPPEPAGQRTAADRTAAERTAADRTAAERTDTARPDPSRPDPTPPRSRKA